jgi:hypothetical protein
MKKPPVNGGGVKEKIIEIQADFRQRQPETKVGTFCVTSEYR